MHQTRATCRKCPRNTRETKGIDFGAEGGHKLPKPPSRHDPGLIRDFRITDEILLKYGYAKGCKGCEAKELGIGKRNHSDECRGRIEKEASEDGLVEAIKRRDERREVEKGKEPEEADKGLGEAAANSSDERFEEAMREYADDMAEEAQGRRGEVRAA